MVYFFETYIRTSEYSEPLYLEERNRVFITQKQNLGILYYTIRFFLFG